MVKKDAWRGEGLNMLIVVRHVSFVECESLFFALFFRTFFYIKTNLERFVLRFEVRTGGDEKDLRLS